jgi:two-component system, OmpR family, KDP operon response regulator KdpE
VARGPRVLVADDDPAIRRLVSRELTTAGYRVWETEPGQDAFGSIAAHQFDLVIMDIDPPAGGGPEAIRTVREISAIPIVALSIRGDEKTTVDVLECGADDYIRKPFGNKELLARVRNALRRRAREEGKPTPIGTGDLEIDLLDRRVRVRGDEVLLPVKLYEVLRVLAEAGGKPVTHAEILCEVWGMQRVDRVAYLRVAIRELRRKLEVDPTQPQYIVTETRFGYRLAVHGRSGHLDPAPTAGQPA